jgi:hypothetical protein
MQWADASTTQASARKTFLPPYLLTKSPRRRNFLPLLHSEVNYGGFSTDQPFIVRRGSAAADLV